MQTTIWRPQHVQAHPIEGHLPKVALEMYEDGEGEKRLGIHFDDTDALGAFGLAIVEEARRLLREQEEVPAGCGEAAP